MFSKKKNSQLLDDNFNSNVEYQTIKATHFFLFVIKKKKL